MSTRTFGSTVLGCIIDTSEAMNFFVENYCKLNPDEFKDSDNPEDDLWTHLNCNEMLRYSDDAGKKIARMFYACYYDEDVFHSPVYFRNMHGEAESYYLPAIVVEADKGLSTNSIINGDFYKTREELIEEFKSKLRRYLPEDYDLENHIGDLDYAITC